MPMPSVDLHEGLFGSRYNQYACFIKLRGVMGPCEIYTGALNSPESQAPDVEAICHLSLQPTNPRAHRSRVGHPVGCWQMG